jgi:hypothetical protein
VIIVSNPQPIRFQRFFKKWTLLMIQNRTAATINIAHEQGEAASAGGGGADGLQYTSANTGTLVPPPQIWWKGELWHTASVAGTQWTLIIVGEADNLDKDKKPQDGCA